MWRMVVIMLGLGFFAETSWAQSNNDAQRCFEEANKNFDLAIHHCTRAIQSGQLSNEDLAITFNNRGLAYRGKGDNDRAIHDYDQAIRLNPNDALAFYNRGLAYRGKGDNDRAIQDYDQAIRLNPNYANAFIGRGNAYNDKNSYDRAIQDYDQAIRLNPNDANAHSSRGYALFYLSRFPQSADALLKSISFTPQNKYAMLFRYLALARNGDGQSALRELGENSATLTDRNWPASVIDFYQGKIDEKTLFAAANDSDPKKKIEQLCEANFYGVQAKLLKGSVKEAIALLRAAEQDCPRTFMESHGASADLKRLGQKQ